MNQAKRNAVIVDINVKCNFFLFFFFFFFLHFQKLLTLFKHVKNYYLHKSLFGEKYVLTMQIENLDYFPLSSDIK